MELDEAISMGGRSSIQRRKLKGEWLTTLPREGQQTTEHLGEAMNDAIPIQSSSPPVGKVTAVLWPTGLLKIEWQHACVFIGLSLQIINLNV